MAEEGDPYVAEIEVWIDGALDQVSILPMKGTSRKLEPAWKYCMDKGIPIDHPASGKGTDTDKAGPPRRGLFSRLFGNKGK